jgi:DNA-binding transcriptional ArsR family regulator
MNVARPYAVFSAPLDLEVLLVLRGTTRPLTGRDVGRLVTRGSLAGVQKALRRLAAHGIIHAEEAGRAVLYTLNRDHLAMPALEKLAGIRVELENKLREQVEAWALPPTHVSMFGSAARGDGDTESDIDLFVVRPLSVPGDAAAWRDQLDRLRSDVYRWTGNHLAISEVDARELMRLERDHPPVVDAFAGDAITLVGPQPRELLGGDRG